MAELLGLEKFMPPIPKEEEYPHPWITDKEQSVRDMWDSMSEKEQDQIINNSPLYEKRALANSMGQRMVNKMPEEFSELRKYLKDYDITTTPEEKIAFAEKNFPNYKFGMINGSIWGQGGKYNDYIPVDPVGVTSPTEFVRDVRDVTWDVGKGALSGMGSVAGATLGAATPIPGGTLAGAMSGAGMASGVANYAEQMKAYDLGIRQRPPSLKEAGIEGLTDSAITMLFGTGATVKSIGKMAERKFGKTIPGSFTNPAAGELTAAELKSVEKANRGLLSRGVSGVAKGAGNFVTGIDSELTKIASDNLDEFRAVSAAAQQPGAEGANAVLDTYGIPARDNITTALFGKMEEVGTNMSRLAKAIPEVDVGPAIKDIDSYARDLSVQYRDALSSSDRAPIREVAKELRSLLFSDTAIEKIKVAPTEDIIRDLTLKLGEASTSRGDKINIVKKILELRKPRPATKGLGIPLKDQVHIDDSMMKNIKELLVQTGEIEPNKIYNSIPSKMTGEQAWSLKKKLARLAKLKERAARPGMVLPTLSEDAQDKLRALGTSSGYMADAIDSASKKMDDIFKGSFKQHSDEYAKYKQYQKVLQPMLGERTDPQKALNVVKNLFSSEGRTSKQSIINELSPETIALAKKIEAYRRWGLRTGQRPSSSLQPIQKSNARSATTKIISLLAGGAAGAGVYSMGGGPIMSRVVAPAVGAAVGLGLNFASDPKTMRLMVDMRDAAKYIAPEGILAGRTIYDLLRERENNDNIKDKEK